MPRLPLSEAVALGRAHLQAGRLREAEAVAEAILAADAAEHSAVQLQGLVAYLRNEYARSEQLFRQAQALAPDNAEYYDNLAVVLFATGRLAEAEAAERTALTLNPGYAEGYNNLGNILSGMGRTAEAEVAYRQSVALRPSNTQAWSNLGNLLRQAARLNESEAAHRQALRWNPRDGLALMNLGATLQDLGRWEDAVAVYHEALAHDPQQAQVYDNLGVALLAQGRIDEALAAHRRAVELQPAAAAPHSNFLMCCQYQPGITPTQLAALHEQWDARHGEPLRSRWRPHVNTTDPDRRVRLGFVGATFGRHPVGRFLVGLLESIDRDAFWCACYSDRLRPDELTERFVAAADLWRAVRRLTDAELAEQIRADQIDLLFDLAGHTSGNRLLCFARKPAPIQLTWAGYVGTTGLAAIDYLMADPYQVAPGSEPCYREQVVRMPGAYVCYDPPADAPPVTPLPAARRGHVTLASFNNLAKINGGVIGLWSQILRRLPTAKLRLKYNGLSDPHVQRRYRQLFAAQGVESDQLELEGYSPPAEVLASYDDVDLALDPFPYSGGLTTCEALWMGVPVVTWPGETFAGRHTLTYLANCGLAECVAADPADYVRRAAALAEDLPRLSALRAGLRQRVAESPLCNPRQFARNFQAAMRQIWQQHVARRRQV